MSYSPTPMAVVIDASVALKAVLPVSGDADEALELIARSYQEKAKMMAPDIWLPETVSAIRQAVYRGLLTNEEGRMAVEDIFALGVEIIPSDVQLCKKALEWAARLDQSKAYDSFYVALAEQVQAECWTADKRLVASAQQVGANWVRSIGVD